MSPAANRNAAPVISDVREVGDQFDVTFTNGRHMRVDKAVNGRYQSRFTYGATSASVNVKPLHSR